MGAVGGGDVVTPTLSAGSVQMLTELLGTINLPVNHPQLEEVAALWANVNRELAAIAEYHQDTP